MFYIPGCCLLVEKDRDFSHLFSNNFKKLSESVSDTAKISVFFENLSAIVVFENCKRVFAVDRSIKNNVNSIAGIKVILACLFRNAFFYYVIVYVIDVIAVFVHDTVIILERAVFFVCVHGEIFNCDHMSDVVFRAL